MVGQKESSFISDKELYFKKCLGKYGQNMTHLKSNINNDMEGESTTFPN